MTIDKEELTIMGIEMYDIYGRKLVSNPMSQVSNPVSINISHLQAGIYFVKITTETGMQSKK